MEQISFALIETSNDDFASKCVEVIQGRLAGVVSKGYIDGKVCSDLSDRFRSNPFVRIRKGDASGKYLGSFHWRKTKEEYLNECREYSAVASSFSTQWQRSFEEIGGALSAQGIRLRPATWDNVQVSVPIVRSWKGDAEFALIPHEDATQCTDPTQVGFEIQTIAPTYPVCSLNLCIENTGGGELLIWNRIPSDSEKIAFGAQNDGGPYPMHFVENSPCLRLRVEPGDIYAFNGQYIHAVTSSLSERVTMSCLMGRVASGDVVAWT